MLETKSMQAKLWMLIGCCCLQVGMVRAEDTTRKAVSNFALPAGGNAQLSLPEDAKAVVVCFLGTECPLARQYAPRLQKIADQYASQGVVFLGVDSNLQDTLAEVEQFRQANNIRFLIGMDYDQQVPRRSGPPVRLKSWCWIHAEPSGIKVASMINTYLE